MLFKALKWYSKMGFGEFYYRLPAHRSQEMDCAYERNKFACIDKKVQNTDFLTKDMKKQEEVRIDNIVTIQEVPLSFMNKTASPTPHMNQSSASRKLVNLCDNLDQLYQAILNFEGCDLKKAATNTVIFDGNPSAKIMLIGEAPGATEDEKGIPFCGQSGKLLDNIIASIGLDRKTTYITNTVFWRPPGNRRPTAEELEICRPFIEKHIALIKPKLIIMVGSTAVESLLRITESITQLRRKFFNYSNQYLEAPIKATAIFHPSYLLRQQGQKKLMWFDMLGIQQFLKQL